MSSATHVPPGRDLAHQVLTPFVPRVVVRWAAEAPGELHRRVEGTVVSADISGFTDLSERLAGLGRAGAEEVVAVVNACFRGMIEDAHAHGGDVLKFGGDALLLLFTGNDHLLRAATASTLLRQRLATPVTGPTAGTVPLSMSIGLQDGAFDLFLVPGGHRELVVIGPDVSRALARESAAGRGEVLVPQDADLPAGWLGPAVEGSAPLVVGPDALPTRPHHAEAPLPTVDLTAYVPDSLLDTLHTGRRYGEIRPATSAFVAFSGVEATLATHGPRELARQLSMMAEVVSTACREYGVHWLDTDASPDGGKLHLVAGAPTKTPDDDTAMLRAVRTILDTCPSPVLRAGVARGHVFVGDVGAPARRTFAAMGDSVNLSARLSGKAEAGQVVAARTVTDAARTRFETHGLPPFQVKGKARPIEAVVVGHPVTDHAGEVGEARAGEHVAPHFVGRDEEVARLESLIASVQDAGRGPAVVVSGQQGIGKSRLVAEVLAHHPELDAFRSAADANEQSTPYHPMLAMLRRLVGLDPSADPVAAGRRLAEVVDGFAPDQRPWLPLIAVPFGARVEPTDATDRIAPAFRRLRLHRAMVDLLRAVVAGPAVLVFQDTQWSDDASRDLVRELVAAAHDRPWLLVLTSSDDEQALVAGAASTTHLPLDRLDDEAAREIVLEVLGDAPVSVRHVDRILERAGGEPLFLIELAAFAAAGGDPEELPGTVEEAVTSAIDQLGPPDRHLLRDAAVLGRDVDLHLLAAVIDDPEVLAPARWEPLAGYVDLVDDDHLRFREHLYHEVAYGGLAFARRRQLHGRIAALLAERFDPGTAEGVEELARHHHRAGDHAASWRYSSMAADRARTRYANVEATALYAQALAAAAQLPDAPPDEVARLHEQRGDVAELAALYDDARDAYTNALGLGGDVLDTVRRVRKLATLDERTGDYEGALARCAGALEDLDGLDGASAEQARAGIQNLAAGVSFRMGDVEDCRSWAERAMASATAADDRSGLARAHYLRALARRDLGTDGSLDDLQAALAVYEDLDDLEGQANVHNNLGVGAYYAGDWEAAVSHYAAAREARQRCGDVVGEAIQANNLGELYSDQGHYAEAREAFEAARRTFRAARYSLEPVAVANLARLELRRGQLAAAADHLAWARDEFERMGAQFYLADVRVRQAEWYVHAGQWEQARAELDALAAPDAAGASDLSLEVTRLRLLGLVQAHTGAVDEAVATLRDAEARGRTLGAGVELLQVLHALAWLQAQHATSVDGEWTVEAADLSARLGVVGVPLVPTPAPPEAGSDAVKAAVADDPVRAADAAAAPTSAPARTIAMHSDDDLRRIVRALAPAEVDVHDDGTGRLRLCSHDSGRLLRMVLQVLAVVEADPGLPDVAIEVTAATGGTAEAIVTVT